MPGILSSIYTQFAVWVLLYLAFAVLYDRVANNTKNIYVVEVLWREGFQEPFVNLLSPTCRDCSTLPARPQSPVAFWTLHLRQHVYIWGGLNALASEKKKGSHTVNFCQFCQMNSFRIKKPKLLEIDCTMKCLYVQSFPFTLFFFLMWEMLRSGLKCFLWDWAKLP